MSALEIQNSDKNDLAHVEQIKPAKKRKPVLAIGQIVGGAYEIKRQIGKGGMAFVYEATQLSLNRSVAIKALHPKLAKRSGFIERFNTEAGVLAAMTHPNIVKVIDKGVEGNIYYFVMEFIDGTDLDEQIVNRTLTPKDWPGIVIGASKALSYVHKQGLVHRDIKPSNIMIDKDQLVRVADFGIAHIITGDGLVSIEGERFEESGTWGTEDYIAPEQSDNSSAVDHRADIYSFGVTIYKMFTGILPNEGRVAPPSELNDKIPPAVDDVIFRAMATDPKERQQSIEAFKNELIDALKQPAVNIASLINPAQKALASSGRLPIPPKLLQQAPVKAKRSYWKPILITTATLGVLAGIVALGVSTTGGRSGAGASTKSASQASLSAGQPATATPSQGAFAGEYALTFKLPQGVHEYRLFYPPEFWIHDENNPEFTLVNGFKNSLINIPEGNRHPDGTWSGYPDIDGLTGEVTIVVQDRLPDQEIYIRGTFNDWQLEERYKLKPVFE